MGQKVSRTAPPAEGRPGRDGWRRVVGGVLAVVAGMGLVLTPTMAQAVELDAITGVTIVEPTDQVTVFENFRVEATWAVPNTAVASDTFTLNFPTNPLVVGVNDSFDLTAPGGVVVGTCAVVSASIICTLSDYVNHGRDLPDRLFRGLPSWSAGGRSVLQHGLR